HVFAVAVRDAAQRAHRAGDDDHRVRRVRAARERGVHAFEIVRLHAGRQAQAAGQFLGDDLLRVVALHDVDFVRLWVEVVEQPLRVERAAGAGEGNEDFHAAVIGRPENYGDAAQPEQALRNA